MRRRLGGNAPPVNSDVRKRLNSFRILTLIVGGTSQCQLFLESKVIAFSFSVLKVMSRRTFMLKLRRELPSSGCPPVALAKSRGFRRNELSELRRLVEENVGLLEERWHEHFGH